MSKASIQSIIEQVRNETQLHGNTRERIASLLTQLNSEKTDRADVESIISEITNISPLFFDQFGNILAALTAGWTVQFSDEEYIDSLDGRKVIRKVTGYVGGTGTLPAALSANIGKYYAKAGGFTTSKADATIYETSELLIKTATTSSTPTAYSPGAFPDGLFEKYSVSAAGSYANFKDSNGNAIVFTEDDLKTNYGFIYVVDNVSTKVLSRKVGAEISNIVNPLDEVKAVSGKAVSDYVSDQLTDIVIPAGTLIPYTKTEGKLLTNENNELSSSSYYFTKYIEILDNSLTYKGAFGSGLPAVCIYDENKVFILGKNSTEMANTSISEETRLLSTDFDLTNAKFVRISCQNVVEVDVYYDKPIITIPTVSVLENSTKPINSQTVQPLVSEIATMQTIIQQQNETISGFEQQLEGLVISPMYFEMTDFLRGNLSDDGASATKIFGATRNSDYQFTANTTDVATLTNGKIYGAVINGKIYRGKLNTSTGVFASYDLLPASFTNFQVSWADGIHLSRNGFKALGEWLANKVVKYGVRTKKTFGIYTLGCDTYEKDLIISGVTKLVMNKINTDTKSGGWIDQPNGIVYTFEVQSPVGAPRIASKFTKQWRMNQNIAGAGLKFTVDNTTNGYLRLVCGLTANSLGTVQILAKDQNGATVYNEELNNKGVTEINIDVTKDIIKLDFEISLKSSLFTSFSIDQIEIFQTAKQKDLISDSGTWLFFCDSWGVFPTLESGETSLNRPDESSLGGLGYFPERFKSYLSENGKDITLYNFSRGNQTSEWGDYWVEEILNRCPTKSDYAVINFFINDCNSAGNLPSTPSNYDFSPTDPWSYQLSSEGGKFGSTSRQEWLDNMQSICRKLIRNGIQPIVIGYPMLAGMNLEYEQRNLLFLNEF